MVKMLKIGADARRDAVSALGIIARAVGSTLGPFGLPAIIEKYQNITDSIVPTVTKDGVTVLSALNFIDPITSAVHSFAKQAANHSVLASGDGTTSTIVMAYSIAEMLLGSGRVTQAYARQVSKDIDAIIAEVRKMAVIDSSLAHYVARTSANDDKEIADIVMDAIGKSTAYSTILVEKNQLERKQYSLKVTNGYHCGRGYQWHPTLAMSCDDAAAENAPFQFKNPYVFLYNGEIHSMEQIEPAIQCIIKSVSAEQAQNGVGLVCYGFDVSEDLANRLIQLNMKTNRFKVMLQKLKLTGEPAGAMQVLMDLASITNSRVFDGGSYKTPKFDDFGTCDYIEFDKTKTVAYGRSKQHWVLKRADQNANCATHAECEFDRDQALARNAELCEGLITITVGGTSAIGERADRVEDAIKAAQAALRAGSVPGCGVTYVKAAQRAGVSEDMQKACACVFDKILENVGFTGNDMWPFSGKNRRPSISNLRDGETFCFDGSGNLKKGRMDEVGVVDAAETIIGTLRHGGDLGILVATTGCASLSEDLKQRADLKLLQNALGK